MKRYLLVVFLALVLGFGGGFVAGGFSEGEAKVRMQVVYKCDPSPEAEEERAWTGTVASKVYDVTLWRAPASSVGR